MHKYKQQTKSLLNFHLLLLILKINIKKTNMQPFFFFQESICNCNIKQTQTQTLGKLIIEIICLFLASYYITLHFFQLLNMTNNSNSIPIWYDMIWPKLKLRYLHLVATSIVGFRYVGAWTGGGWWNWSSILWLTFWLHVIRSPCSFKRLAVKKQQCKNHSHLQNVEQCF